VIDSKRVIPFGFLENAIAGDLRRMSARDEGRSHGERERRRIACKREAARAARSNRNESDAIPSDPECCECARGREEE